MAGSQPDMENAPPPRARKFGVLLFCLALLVTLFGAFYFIENWRGKKKWEAYKRQLEAEGAKLDLAAFVPPAIRDEQNFAATPFFDDMLPGPKPADWNQRYWPETFNHLNPQPSSGKQNERQLTDLVAWRMALKGETNGAAQSGPDARAKAAAEVLADLKVYEAALRELRAASARPLARYDIHYNMENPWGILLPHLLSIKQVTRLLSVRACAELAAGNTEGAMEDIRLMMRIVDSMESEVFLINYLVRVAAFHFTLQPVWEGLALGQWSDAQLAELQRMMLRPNFVEDLEMPLQTERAAGILTADLLLKQRYRMDMLTALSGGSQPSYAGLKNALFSLIPRGWYRMEQFEYARLFQQFMLPGFDGTNRVVSPAVVESNQKQFVKVIDSGWTPLLTHRVLARLLMPAVGHIHRKAAQAQTAAHQAAIACALERHRRKHGNYPNELAMLAPEFMTVVPHDVIAGKPMHYKSAKPIALYSVGWDDKDNGGTPGKVLWDERGDWVWTYPNL